MKYILLAACLVFALPNSAKANEPDIAIDHVRALPAADNAQSSMVYLTIKDKVSSDRLQAVTTPVAAGVAIKRAPNQLGIMRSGDLHGIDVEKNIPLVFAPDGYYLLLTGLTQSLQAGDKFPMTLIFQHAGAIETTVTVTPKDAAP